MFVAIKAKFGDTWSAIHPEDAARMQMQNRFRTGLDIAKYTAAIMRVKTWLSTMLTAANTLNLWVAGTVLLRNKK
jgi:isocitrate lyase